MLTTILYTNIAVIIVAIGGASWIYLRNRRQRPLTRKELITDEALEAPLKLAKAYDQLSASFERMTGLSKNAVPEFTTEKLIWERLPSDNAHVICRAKVFGGWLIIVTNEVITQMPHGTEQGYEWRESVTFVPDKWHRWKLKE